MRNTTILLATLVATVGGCYTGGDDEGTDAGTNLGELISDLTMADCAKMTKPFSQTGCPDPATMADDAARKTKCEAVKAVALNDFETQIGRKPDCSDGWIFGPDNLNTACIKDSGKNICKLAAKNPPSGQAGWPTNNTYSQCLNDWVVYCTATFPETMGITGTVCFHKDIDWDRLGAGTVTGREACQRVKDGKFPDKCGDDFCKPKKKPATAKKKGGTCASTSTSSFTTPTPVPCEEESFACEECDPDTDSDCVYDTTCGCETCEPGDEDPACSEDLECPLPDPTPTPTPSPSPSPSPSPTVTPTPSPTVSPTPSPTVTPTPSPTVYPTPSPTSTPS